MNTNTHDQDGTLLITRREVSGLLNIKECMDAVEKAFALHAEGKTQPPKNLGIHVKNGGFHIKAGVMQIGHHYFVAKSNANFPLNPKNYGLPTIQGVVIVADADNGRLLALMDSMEITLIRTGAATGVAAKHLSRQNSKIATICGCGNQGRISLQAILAVRKLEHIYVYDIDPIISQTFAREISETFNLTVEPVSDLHEAVRQSDICVTCTPSKKSFLDKEFVKAGAFIAAVGADSEEKQEIDPALLASSKLVVDLLEQSAVFGDLHHAIALGILTRADVHAELGEVIAGLKPGRTSEEEIIVFDSTGTALQDVVAAAIVYERARASGFERKLNFSL